MPFISAIACEGLSENSAAGIGAPGMELDRKCRSAGISSDDNPQVFDGAAIELLLFQSSFLVNSRLPNLVIQNNVDGAVRACEFDPALICDLSNSNNVLAAAGRAPNDAAVRAHLSGIPLKVPRRTL